MAKDANPFYALAKVFWNNGEDGEVLARQLAEATALVIKEGTNAPVAGEFVRLLIGTRGDPAIAVKG